MALAVAALLLFGLLGTQEVLARRFKRSTSQNASRGCVESKELLLLIDRLISSAREEPGRDLDVFNQLIDPLFKEFEKVALDTLGVFRKARDLLETSNEPATHAAFVTIRARREEMLEVRHKVGRMVKVYWKSKQNTTFMKLLWSMDTFLSGPHFRQCGRSTGTGSPLSRLVDVFDYLFNTRLVFEPESISTIFKRRIEKQEAQKLVEEAISCLERDWAKAAEHYAEARRALVVP